MNNKNIIDLSLKYIVLHLINSKYMQIKNFSTIIVNDKMLPIKHFEGLNLFNYNQLQSILDYM